MFRFDKKIALLSDPGRIGQSWYPFFCWWWSFFRQYSKFTSQSESTSSWMGSRRHLDYKVLSIAIHWFNHFFFSFSFWNIKVCTKTLKYFVLIHLFLNSRMSSDNQCGFYCEHPDGHYYTIGITNRNVKFFWQSCWSFVSWISFLIRQSDECVKREK